MHPIQSLSLTYSDENYEYFILDPAEFDSLGEKVVESERPIMDELSKLIDKNGIETNPYVIKIKISEK